MRGLYWVLMLTESLEIASAFHEMDSSVSELTEAVGVLINESSRDEIDELVSQERYDGALLKITAFLIPFIPNHRYLLPLLEESWTLLYRFAECWLEPTEKSYERLCSEGLKQGSCVAIDRRLAIIGLLKGYIETCKLGKRRLYQCGQSGRICRPKGFGGTKQQQPRAIKAKME